jgi:hypothetical protein
MAPARCLRRAAESRAPQLDLIGWQSGWAHGPTPCKLDQAWPSGRSCVHGLSPFCDAEQFGLRAPRSSRVSAVICSYSCLQNELDSACSLDSLRLSWAKGMGNGRVVMQAEFAASGSQSFKQA